MVLVTIVLEEWDFRLNVRQDIIRIQLVRKVASYVLQGTTAKEE